MYANLPLSKKIPHIAPIVPVYFVIIEVIFTMTYYIILNDTSNAILKLISLFVFLPLAFMVIVTHLKSMLTSPGYVPIPYRLLKPQSSSSTEGNNHNDTFCKKCNNPRPPRAHHCKICGKCTLKMDHHCPWVANCVGYNNQKNFYQFLFYATTGDCLAAIILMIRLFNLDYNIKSHVPAGTKITSPFQLMWFMWEPIQTFVGFACALAMTISIGTLFRKQTYMLFNNQTTIDAKMYPEWESGPYYEKDQWKSFSSVMGKTVTEWISLGFKGNDPTEFEKVRSYTNLEDV